MRTPMLKKATGYLATASLVTSSFFVVIAQPVQAASTTSVSIQVDGRNDSPGVVRSTNTKTETAPKDQQKHDKKAISRCWSRLMTMVREVSHTHRNTKK